VKYIS